MKQPKAKTLLYPCNRFSWPASPMTMSTRLEKAVKTAPVLLDLNQGQREARELFRGLGRLVREAQRSLDALVPVATGTARC